MTKFEYAQLIGYRAVQISAGMQPTISPECYDLTIDQPSDIAIKELNNLTIPLKIKRTTKNGEVELDPNEMRLL